MANLTKSYETVFVLSNKLTEEATAELVKKFTDRCQRHHRICR